MEWYEQFRRTEYLRNVSQALEESLHFCWHPGNDQYWMSPSKAETAELLNRRFPGTQRMLSLGELFPTEDPVVSACPILLTTNLSDEEGTQQGRHRIIHLSSSNHQVSSRKPSADLGTSCNLGFDHFRIRRWTGRGRDMEGDGRRRNGEGCFEEREVLNWGKSWALICCLRQKKEDKSVCKRTTIEWHAIMQCFLVGKNS